ncbi:MAG TPA: YfcE family phosphodiesterase [Gemmatales bacterium]|nr:YfcE family phosphodiesterase [Gemmatales bacterium]
MLVGIISDTHDRLARTTSASKLLHESQVEAIIHCGDICSFDILALFAGTPLYFVMGNNDDDVELRQASQQMEHLHYLNQGAVIELAGKHIGVTHGHLYRVVNELLNQKPDYLFSGHTHHATNEMNQGVHCINPGALHRASEYSIATLNLLTDELRFLRVPS